jgi:pimeloyl-ACP methyl ester carboxylesterase
MKGSTLLPALLIAGLGCADWTELLPRPRESSSGEASGAPAPPTSPRLGYDQYLSGYPYPYPVKYFELDVQGVPLFMAYMDERPSNENGQTVLLLHGKNFSGAYWQGTAERLLALGYRVVLPDQLGFGKSSKPTSIQYSFDLLARSTAELLDSIAVDTVAVIGHSMGGMLATRFVLEYSERASKFVLVNPIGLEDYRRVLPYLGVDGWTEQSLRQTPETIRNAMQQNYFHGTWTEAYDPLLDIQVGWVLGPDRDVMARVAALTQDMVFTQPVLYEFSHVQVPTLLVIGQLDRTAPGRNDVPPEVGETLANFPRLGRDTANAIADCQLVELAGIGHLPQYEAFESWIGPLESFLAAP